MKFSVETQLIHPQGVESRINGAVKMPIFQSAMFEHGDDTVRYIRYNNTPNQDVLNKKLAALENAEEALVTGSGMTAISGALLAILRPGDHILVQQGLYGGTYAFARDVLNDWDIAVDFFDGDNPESWERLLRSETRAIYAESITNPLLQVCNLERVVAFARANKLVSLIDNTFATPINYRPPEHGFDLSLHSATKYMNGHSDIVAGAIIGRGALVRCAGKILSFLGGSLDPHACFLLDRGLQTLPLRVRYQNNSALQLATFLSEHTAIAHVNYPGLTNHPHYARATKLFDGFGGVISFELQDNKSDVMSFIHALKLPILAPSLGGVESLITRPAMSSHALMTPAERHSYGITDSLVRISVGIEATADLQADLAQALHTYSARNVNTVCDT